MSNQPPPHSHQPQRQPNEGQRGLISDHEDDQDVTEVVRRFTGELPSHIENLMSCLQDQELADARQVVQELRTACNSFENASIGKAVAAVEGAIDAGQSIDEIRKEIDALVLVCQRLIV